MDRSARRGLTVFVTCLLVCAMAATQNGCVSALATALWVIKGNDVKPEFDKLHGKRVAIVCRPLVELQYSTGARSAQDLSNELGRLLAKRVRKINVVDPRAIAEWTDNHEWSDFAEVGRAVKADMVIGVDIEEFSLYQSQTLYQGRSRLVVTVYDVAADGEVVYHKSIPRVAYPPNRGVDTAMPEDDFRRRFVAHLADLVGRHFYSHDSQADFALDSKGIGDE